MPAPRRTVAQSQIAEVFPPEDERQPITHDPSLLVVSDDSGNESEFFIPEELQVLDNSFISVWKIEGPMRTRLYACRYDTKDFSLERLKADYGGGEYAIRMYATNPKSGRPSCFISQTHKLVGPGREPPLLNPPAVQHPAAPDQSALMLEGFRALATGMQAGFTALAERMAPKESSRREMLEEMQMLQEILGGNRQGSNPLGLLREVMGVVKELTPVDPDTSPAGMLLSAVDRILPMITSAMENQGAPAQPRPQPRTALPVPAATTAPSLIVPGGVTVAPLPQPQTEADVNIAQRIQLKMGLQFLCARAADDGDPELYADVVLEQVPEDELAEILGRPDWFAVLSGLHGPVAQYPQWFAELRDAILTPADEPAESGPSLTPVNGAGKSDEVGNGET